MSELIQLLSFNYGSFAPDQYYYSPSFTTDGYVNLSFSLASNGPACKLSIIWSASTIDTQITYTQSIQCTSGGKNSVMCPIRARYVKIIIENLDYPLASDDILVQTLGFRKASNVGLDMLENAGTGIQIYKPSDYTMKTLFAGEGINLVDGPSDITVKNSAEILNVGVGTINLMKDGTLSTGNYEIHRLQAGTNITLAYDPSDGIIISSTGGTTSLGTVGNLSSVNLVNDGIGPTLALKELVPSTNILMTQDDTSIFISTKPILTDTFSVSLTPGTNSNIYFSNTVSNTARLCLWRANRNMRLSGLSLSPITNYGPAMTSLTGGTMDFSIFNFPNDTNPTSLGSETYYSPNPFYSVPYTAVNTSSTRYHSFYSDALSIDITQGDIIGFKLANNFAPASSLSEMVISLYFQ